MKLLKNTSCLLLALILLTFGTACGKADKTWAIKGEKMTVPIGVYVFYLKESYNKALEKLAEDNITPEILEASSIGDKSASEWIKDDALDSCKEYVVVEKLFDENGLSFEEEELKKMDENTDSIWDDSNDELSKYGTREDFHRAFSTFYYKRNKLFSHLYSDDKFRTLDDNEILDYYKKNYVSLSRFSKVFTENLEDDETPSTVTEENRAKVDKQFQGYVDSINNGSKSFEQVAQEFKNSENATDDPVITENLNLKDDSIDEDFYKTITEIQPGKATYSSVNDIFILLYKNDITAHLPDLNNEDSKREIIESIKLDEFDDMINSQKNNLSFTINDEALKDYSPISLFN
ncbi:MAG: hypothetical protein IJ758_03415 [Clostridia bacterium]|nr:hypothetical protein [Clostridia bacterium]